MVSHILAFPPIHGWVALPSTPFIIHFEKAGVQFEKVVIRFEILVHQFEKDAVPFEIIRIKFEKDEIRFEKVGIQFEIVFEVVFCKFQKASV